MKTKTQIKWNEIDKLGEMSSNEIRELVNNLLEEQAEEIENSYFNYKLNEILEVLKALNNHNYDLVNRNNVLAETVKGANHTTANNQTQPKILSREVVSLRNSQQVTGKDKDVVTLGYRSSVEEKTPKPSKRSITGVEVRGSNSKYPDKFFCHKCKCKLKDYRPIIQGNGCSYCEPKCPYCNKYLEGFLMDHMSVCQKITPKKEGEKK